MSFVTKLHARIGTALLGLFAFGALVPTRTLTQNNEPAAKASDKAADPWSQAEVLRPADLAHELSGAKAEHAPTIVYVGFHTLFAGGHVPEASFHGTASTEKGLADLKEWAASLPRSTNLIIYCGCCPFDRCPNIRPAYKALREVGFAHVRVLVLPTSFAADWVEQGYPMQKGQ
jgi:thiosulfate/3-mercaptopyruvate sulfurtransferase